MKTNMNKYSFIENAIKKFKKLLKQKKSIDLILFLIGLMIILCVFADGLGIKIRNIHKPAIFYLLIGIWLLVLFLKYKHLNFFNKNQDSIYEYRYEIILAVFLIIYLFLCIPMTSKGLPHLTDMDEEYIVSRVITMAQTGDLDYKSYYWGGVPYYLLFFIYSAYYLIFYANSIPFEKFVMIPPENFYHIARLTNVILSLIVIYLVFHLGKKLYDRKTGLIASLLLGVGIYYYITATMVRIDILTMVFVLMAFIWIYKITYETSISNYLKAAVFIGLATGTKYYGLLMFLPMIYAHFTAKKEKKRKSGYLLYSFLVITVIFVLTNLAPLLHWSSFMKDLSIHVSSAGQAHWSTIEVTSITKYGNMFLYNIGIIGTLVFIISVLRYFSKPSKKDSLLLIYPLTHFMLAIKSNMVYPRYMIVITPLFWIFMAKSFNEFFEKRPKTAFYKYSYRILLALLLILPSIKTLEVFISTFKPVTSDQAYEWINRNIQPGMGIWYEAYTVKPDAKNYRITRFNNIKRINLTALKRPESSCQYLIIRKDSGNPEYRKRLMNESKIEKEFLAERGKVSGPNIVILRIETNSSDVEMNRAINPFTPADFPASINIGIAKEDERYLGSGWSKVFYGPQRGYYRWIRTMPAIFYFKLSDTCREFHEIKMNLHLLVDETGSDRTELKYSLNGEPEKEIALKNGLNECIIILNKENLKFRDNQLNSIVFRATYNTQASTKRTFNTEDPGPQIRINKMIFSR